MKLYLVQHGDAVPKEVDPERPLSKQGRADVERLAAFLGGRHQVARVIQSGKTRARQTAEILAADMAPGIKIESMAGLNPLDPVEPFAHRVAGWSKAALVVGHLPFMARCVSCLITGNDEPVIVDYRPGSIVCLERGEAGNWAVAWMLRPELTAA